MRLAPQDFSQRSAPGRGGDGGFKKHIAVNIIVHLVIFLAKHYLGVDRTRSQCARFGLLRCQGARLRNRGIQASEILWTIRCENFEGATYRLSHRDVYALRHLPQHRAYRIGYVGMRRNHQAHAQALRYGRVVTRCRRPHTNKRHVRGKLQCKYRLRQCVGAALRRGQGLPGNVVQIDRGGSGCGTVVRIAVTVDWVMFLK